MPGELGMPALCVREGRWLVSCWSHARGVSLCSIRPALALNTWHNAPPPHRGKNYVVSLSEVTRWLAKRAEALGVEIYSGFAGKNVSDR